MKIAFAHEQELEEITDWCEKVEDGELTLSCNEYEEYGDSYWDNDWITEYEDPYNLGGKIERFYEIAEQCVYDRDYQTANAIYNALGSLEITAYNEDSGDGDELGISREKERRIHKYFEQFPRHRAFKDEMRAYQ